MAKDVWVSDVHDGTFDDQEVELKGWVHRTRGSNKIWFLVLRDSTGIVQCVIKRDDVGDECFENLKTALIPCLSKLASSVFPSVSCAIAC